MTTRIEELELKLSQAEEELRQLNTRLEHRPEFGHGKGAARGYDWQMALARKKRAQAHIEDLRHALSRLEDGSYGRCRSCGRQIDAERLQILPTARLCMACKRNQPASGSARDAHHRQATQR